MIRQICEALRFAVLDFFNVPWQAVVWMLTIVVLLIAFAYFRTVDFAPSLGKSLLLTAALALLYLWRRLVR